jgi:hypothetical protein
LILIHRLANLPLSTLEHDGLPVYHMISSTCT